MANNKQEAVVLYDLVTPSGKSVSGKPLSRDEVSYLIEKGYKVEPSSRVGAFTPQAAIGSVLEQSAPGRFVRGLQRSLVDPLINIGKTAVGLQEPQTSLGQGFKERGFGAAMPPPSIGGAIGDIVQGTGEAHLEQFKKAGSLLSEGLPKLGLGQLFGQEQLPPELIEAGGRGLAGLVPLIGPASAQAGETIGRGDVAGGTGEVVGLIAGLTIPDAPRVVRSIRTKPSTTVIAKGTLRAISPPKSTRLQLSETLPVAIEEVQNVSKMSGKPIETLTDLRQASHDARVLVGHEIEQVLAAKGGLVIDGNKLADAMEATVTNVTKDLDPRGSAQVLREARRYRKEYNLETAESLRQGLNAQLGFMFRKNRVGFREAAGEPLMAAKLALRDALELEIESSLKASGDSLKGIRQRYSALRKLEDATHDKIINELTRELPGFTDFQSLDTITAGAAISAAILGQGRAAAGIGLTALARRAIVVLEGRMRSPNARIKSAFSGQKSKTLSTPAKLVAAELAAQEPSDEE